MLHRRDLLPGMHPARTQRQPESSADTPRAILIVVDGDFNVVLVSRGLERELDASDEFVDVEGRRLGPLLDKIVRDLVTSWSKAQSETSRHVVAIPPTYVVSAVPLYGYAQRFAAVAVEVRGYPNTFARGARTYALSPREAEVLSQILAGASALEIASALSLAESTVQCYFKHLLRKTGSRNRASMVAKVLGWDGSRPLAAAATRQRT
jgi:DNA-binding CsgD family transcriptional regulator